MTPRLVLASGGTIHFSHLWAFADKRAYLVKLCLRHRGVMQIHDYIVWP